MDEMYGMQSTDQYLDKALTSSENLVFPADYESLFSSVAFPHRSDHIPMFGSDDFLFPASAITEAEAASNITPEIQREDAFLYLIKAKIASHPRYPRLLQAYIACQKVGAPPEMATVLEEIGRESDLCKRDLVSTCGFGADPKLDDFMETYCDMLVKYKDDLERPFDEATAFLNTIETQLTNLCNINGNGSSIRSLSDEGAASSDDGFSGGEVEVQHAAQTKAEGRDLKDRLLRRFGSHIVSLKLEFSKKRKKAKLPREARQTLTEWWNAHCKWPYPTEADKMVLAESTGLDQKQINNWFINQRKRHWKPSENMQFEVMMDSLSGRCFTEDS